MIRRDFLVPEASKIAKAQRASRCDFTFFVHRRDEQPSKFGAVRTIAKVAAAGR